MSHNHTDPPGNTIQQTTERKRKSTNKHHKLSLTCVICNGIAHGYNFDAISCESCKAFFRRNALQPPGKLKCRSHGHCDVTSNQTKRCKKCRMEKCLAAGMRKEWILTDQERQEKRIKIEENRRLKQNHDNEREYQQPLKIEPKIDGNLSKDVGSLSSSVINQVYMTEADWLKIKLIENAYTEAVKLNQTAGISQYPSIQPLESTFELFRVPIFISSMRLITYFKQIPEFRQLDKDEQVYLVKSNTLTTAFLHSVFIYDPNNAVYHEQGTNDPLFLENDWMNSINKELCHTMKHVQNDLIGIIHSDDKIIKIIFLIILFSNYFTFKYSTKKFNTLSIFRAQNIYIELLCKYCLHHYGLHKSTKLFLRYMSNIMKLQKLIAELKSTIHDYIDITKLSPLMQSLL